MNSFLRFLTFFAILKKIKKKGNYKKSRLVKLQTAGVNENKKNSNNKICMQQKTLRMWLLSRQNKSRQKLSRGFI